MATSLSAGVNFEVDGTKITFFGAKGISLENGKWAINTLGDNAFVEVNPDSIKGKINDCLQDDEQSGNLDQVAQLQLAPRQAVVFFLEGGITREHLTNAIEGVDFIDVPSVEVFGHTLTVRILANPAYDVTTADKNGLILGLETDAITFNPARAMRFDPLKVLKIARIVERPEGESTTIQAEWGSDQTFLGTYVEILDKETGEVKYGSAYQEWMNTNTPWEGVENGWFKSSPVDAYQATEAGRLTTTLASGVVETVNTVNIGDWLVRQQDGEIMCVSAEKFPTLYDVNSGRPPYYP